MKDPFQKESAPDFSKTHDLQKFLESTQSAPDLLQKEIDVNLAEQVLLEKRIQIMKSLINDLPSSDPQYSMLITQLQMDQIEVDELKRRRMAIEDLLKSG